MSRSSQVLIAESNWTILWMKDLNHPKAKLFNYFIQRFNLTDTKELIQVLDLIEIIRRHPIQQSDQLIMHILGKPYELINISSNLIGLNDLVIKTLFSHGKIMKIIGILEFEQKVFIVQELKLDSLKNYSLSKKCNWKKVMIDLISVVIFLVSKSVLAVSLDPEHLVVGSGEVGIKYLDGYHLQHENYQAPEFMHTGLVNQSSLVWTLGCVLVFLLTGSEPFQGIPEGLLKFEILDKDFRLRTLGNKKLAGVNEVLKRIFRLKQNKRISIEMLLALIQNI